MSWESDSFKSCEFLIKKHVPLWLRIGEPLKKERKDTRVPGTWRPRLDEKTKHKMKRLRAKGMAIGDVARACGVSWGLAFKYSKP